MSADSFCTSELCFDFLDDLALASERGRVNPYSHLKVRHTSRIGPLLELVSLARAGVLPLNALSNCKVKEALSRAFLPNLLGKGAYVKTGNFKIGFIVTNRDPNVGEQAQWIAFCRRAQEAAEMSLPKPIAQGLIGAMREIEENIHIHSERAHDGIVGFRGTPGEFEFTIVDSGVGVLESLRSSPEYQHLNDSGIAIKTAITDGESSLRHLELGRGYGFRDLFVGLANLNSNLRFRSGNHALTIDGATPTVITSRLSQKVEITGFLVNILCCKLHQQIIH